MWEMTEELKLGSSSPSNTSVLRSLRRVYPLGRNSQTVQGSLSLSGSWLKTLRLTKRIMLTALIFGLSIYLGLAIRVLFTHLTSKFNERSKITTESSSNSTQPFQYSSNDG